MKHPVLVIFLCFYFGLNFFCALALHMHADRQAHLRLRVMDVFVHFVLLTAFGAPALLAVLLEALFGGERSAKTGLGSAKAGARAA